MNRSSELPCTQILVIKRDKLGDLILTSPLIETLKESMPNAQVDLLAARFTLPVLAACPLVRRAIPLPKVRGVFGSLRGFQLLFSLLRMRLRRYDWVISAGGEYSHRAIRLAIWVGAKRSVAFCPPELWKKYPALTDPISPQSVGHESRRMLELVRPISGQAIFEKFPAPYPRVWLGRDAIKRADTFLLRYGLRSGGFVVIGLGARKAKRQPSADQVIRWVDFIKNEVGLDVVLSFTPGKPADPKYPEDGECAAVIMRARPGVPPLAGSLEEALGVISLAKCSVIPDSGLMHAAAASPGGVVALFADPTRSPSPEQWGPIGPRVRIVVAKESISSIEDEAILTPLCQLLQAESGAQ